MLYKLGLCQIKKKKQEIYLASVLRFEAQVFCWVVGGGGGELSRET